MLTTQITQLHKVILYWLYNTVYGHGGLHSVQNLYFLCHYQVLNHRVETTEMQSMRQSFLQIKSMNRQWTGLLPFRQRFCLLSVSRHPLKVRDPSALLFDTISDPRALCWSKTECVWKRRRRRCRNEVRMSSPVTSHLAEYHCTAAFHPSASSVHVTASESPPVTDYPRRCPDCFSPKSHFIPLVKVHYVPRLCIHQCHHGNLHSRGRTLVL